MRSKENTISFEEAKNCLSYEEYNRLLSECELQQIELVSLSSKKFGSYENKSFKLEPNLTHKYFKTKKNQSYKFETNFSLHSYEARDNSKGSDSKRDKLVEIQCKYNIYLTTDNDLPEEFLVIYINLTLGLVIWPFIREMVVDISQKMMLPPIILPMIRVG